MAVAVRALDLLSMIVIVEKFDQFEVSHRASKRDDC